MKRLSLLFVALIALSALGAAHPAHQDSSQHVETVLLASTTNYPDAMIASAPANKLGVPVLLTDKNQLTDSTRNSIQKLGADQVITVGGPAVISDSVQNEVDSMVNSTTRLFGTTQIGTSIQVSSYFWSEGSDSATIVQYPQNAENGYKLLSAIKNEVQDEDEPILISKPGTLSASVLTEVNSLGATEVEVYSTNAVNVTEDLKGVGVQQVEVEETEKQEQEQENETKEVEELSEQVQTRAAETSKNKSTLVIVAAANFKDAISIPTSPNSASFVVGNQEQVSEAVKLARETDAEKIKVTGKPDFAQTIADRIESETDKTVQKVSGTPEEVASEITEENEKEWNQLQEEKLEKWEEEVRNSPKIRKQANKTLQKALNQIDSNSSEEAQELAVEAQEAFQEGEYFEARNNALKALSIVNSEQYQKMSSEEVRQEVEDEREDMKEVENEMKELSREKAQELKEAETEEERLEIIQEFKEERKELRQERKEEQEEEKERESESEKERPGGSEVSLETKGTIVKSEASYKAPNQDFNLNKEVNVEGNQVNFQYTANGENQTGTLKKLEAEASKTLEKGTYTVTATLTVNGKQLNQISKEVKLPSFKEFENEIEKETEKEEEEETEQEQEENEESEDEKETEMNETETGNETES